MANLIDTILDFVLNNPWRSIAIAALALLWIVSFADSIKIDNLNAKIDSYRSQLALADVKYKEAVQANSEWEGATMWLQTSLANCQSQWADAKKDADYAVEIAKAFRDETVRQKQEFDRRWKERGATCSQSLVSMQAACESTIGEY